MAINIFSQNINTIKNKYDYRLSPKYYNLKNLFFKLKSSGWKIYTLGEISPKIESGSYIDKYVNNGVRYIRVGDIKKFAIDESESAFIEAKNIKGKMVLKTGDVFFGRTQAVTDKLGVFSIADEQANGSTISQHVVKVHAQQFVSNEYLVAYLNSKFGKSQMDLASFGDTRVEFTHNQIKEINVLILPEDIVISIEDKVKDLQHYNRKAQYYFKEAQNIIDSVFNIPYAIALNKMPTKNLLLENSIWNATCYKSEYINLYDKIKDNFKYDKLSNLVKPLKKGLEIGSDSYLVEMEKDENSIPFIRTSDIFNNEIDMYPDYYANSLNLTLPKSFELINNDILYSKDGKIGQVGIVNDEDFFIPCSGFSILRTKSNTITANYLYAILSHKNLILYQAKMKTVIATTIPHLKPDKINDFIIPIFDEKYIKEIDNLIANFRNCIIKKNKLLREIDELINYHYDKIIS